MIDPGAGPSTVEWDAEAEPAPARPPGGDRYQLLGELGRGGMAVVHRAVDRQLEREVALKLVRPDRVGARERARLLGEARALARLRHPNVVTVYDVEELDGQIAIAMEPIDGGSLRAWLATARAPDAVVAALIGAGRGLAAAHRAGLVHRDFKPDNVLVDGDGVARVADFGVALAIEERGDAPTPLAGTPAYLAPELLDGAAATTASDQYAFGVTLVEALTGRRPFAATSLEERRASRDADPALDGLGAAWLRAIAARALAARPADRFASMDELVAALGRDPAARRRRWGRRGAIVAAVAVAGVAGARWAAGGPDVAAVCAASARPMTGIWDGNRRAVLEERLGQLDAPFQRAMTTTVVTGLDAYAEALVAAELRACTLDASGPAGRERATRRRACLERGRNQLGTVVDRLLGGDAGSLARAGLALDALAPVAACERLDAMAVPELVPDDPARARASAELLAAIDRTRVDIAMHQARRVVPTLTAALAEARALGHGPTLAEALLTLGNAEASLDAPDYEAHMREALVVAQTSGFDVLVGRTAALLGLEIWRMQGRVPEAAQMVQLGLATSARLGRPPELELVVNLAETIIAREQGRLDDSEAAGARALAAAQAAAVTPVRRSDVLNALAATARARGDYPAAAARYREARAIMAGAWGESHPALGIYDNNLAAIALADGHPAAAATSLRAAIAAAEARGSRTGAASGRSSLAFVLDMAGQPDLALAESERAVAAAVDAFGPGHPRTAEIRTIRARILLGAGRSDAGAAAVAEVRAAPELPRALALVLTSLDGQVAWLRGDRAAARATWRQVVATAEPADTDAISLARLALAIDARARGATDEALEHAVAARAAAAASDGPRAPLAMAATVEEGLARLAGGDVAGRVLVDDGLSIIGANPRFADTIAAAAR